MITRARTYFQEDVELCQDYGDVAGECQMHSHLGECEWLLGNADQAVSHYERSMELSQSAISNAFALLGLMKIALAEGGERLQRYAPRTLRFVEENTLAPFLVPMFVEVLDQAPVRELGLQGQDEALEKLGVSRDNEDSPAPPHDDDVTSQEE